MKVKAIIFSVAMLVSGRSLGESRKAVDVQTRVDVPVEELWRIGDDDEGMIFGDIRSVLEGEDGTLFVLDGQVGMVSMFDAEGKWLRNLGGPGEGPGQYNHPWGLFSLEEHRVAVTQRMGSRMAVHVVDYAHPFEEFATEDLSLPVFGVMDGKMLPDGHLLLLADVHRVPQFTRSFKLLELGSRDASVLEEFLPLTPPVGARGEKIPEWNWDQYEMCWATEGDDLFVAPGDDYQVIHVDLSHGEEEPLLAQPEVERCARTQDENDMIAGEWGLFFAPRATKDDVRTRKQHRAILGVSLHRDAELWLQVATTPCDRRPQAIAHIDVWSLDGSERGKITLTARSADVGSPYRNRIFLRGHRMYVATKGGRDQRMQLIAFSLPKNL